MTNPQHARGRKFWRNKDGAVAVYMGLLSTLLMGSGVIAVDVGKVVALKSSMQNAADAAAISAATQLDGRSGAINRATAVAQNALHQRSNMADSTADYTVASLNFYRQVDPSRLTTSDDEDAAFVEVALAPKQVTMLLMPVLDMLSGGGGASYLNIQGVALATPGTIICDAPSFMICDPSEAEGASADLMNSANSGKQVRLKSGGGGSLAPGNFGLLCPQDGSNCGASSIGNRLASLDDGACYGSDLVETSTGVQTNQIKNGVNARFDLGNKSPKYPARNVIAYPRDPDIIGSSTQIVGNGNWNLSGYWVDKHGVTPPAVLTAGGDASRYQTYLYESGESFARDSRKTLYPAPSTLPSGYSLVTPPGSNIPVDATYPNDNDFDGVPASAPVADPNRRVVKAAILQCDALGVAGSHEYPVFNNYVSIFLTEEVDGAPDAIVFGEVIGATQSVDAGDFRANTHVVE